MNTTHHQAVAREALRDIATFDVAHARLTRAQAEAWADGRLSWAILTGHTLNALAEGSQAASREVARMAVAGVDVHAIMAEVAAERTAV